MSSLAAVANCRGEIGEPTQPAPSSPPASSGVERPPSRPAIAARRVRRLSRREYNNAIESLLRDTSRPADAFPVETYSNGFDNGSSDLTVSPDLLSAYQIAAETLAARAVSNTLSTLLNGCDPAVQSVERCRETFLSSFASRAYRRAVTVEELERLRTVFSAGMQSDGFVGGVRTAIEAVLQSPSFLYREELGAPVADATTNVVVRLTLDELATELAFFLTGFPPDEALREAARSGALESEAVLEQHARRLLATEAARENLVAFARQWLGVTELRSIQRSHELYPSFDHRIANAMADEIDFLSGTLLWQEHAGTRALFSTTRAYANAPLAAVYGVSLPPNAPAQPLVLEERTRRGLLTRAGLLAAHSAPEESAPIARGVFLRQAVLCAAPPPPPPDVLARFRAMPRNAMITTRARYEAHVSDDACRSCHRLIDGVGFGLESYDAMGAFRSMEAGQPINAQGDLVGTDVDGPYVGGSELSLRLARSTQVSRCVATQLTRFALGTAGREDRAWSVVSVPTANPDTPLVEMMVSLVTSRVFREREVSDGQ